MNGMPEELHGRFMDPGAQTRMPTQLMATQLKLREHSEYRVRRGHAGKHRRSHGNRNDAAMPLENHRRSHFTLACSNQHRRHGALTYAATVSCRQRCSGASRLAQLGRIVCQCVCVCVRVCPMLKAKLCISNSWSTDQLFDLRHERPNMPCYWKALIRLETREPVSECWV